MYSQYKPFLCFGSLGLAVVVQLAKQKRIKEVSRDVPQPVRKRIQQLIRNTTDRTFVRVTYNCDSKVLVSHDYQDFQQNKRISIQRELTVRIIEACECCAEL